MNEGDVFLENDLDGEGRELRKEASNHFWMNLRIKENMLIQKARLKWLNDGDLNIKFFHRVMKERGRHNHIRVLNTQGGMVESVSEVKADVFYHFSRKFIESDSHI